MRFKLRTLLLLPATVALVLMAIDPFTARPCYWRLAVVEFDVVDARDRRPIQAYVTMTYVGPLAGQPGSGNFYRTLGLPYEKYHGLTPDVGYGGLACIVRHRPGTLIFRRHDLTITDGVRFRVEADGYEPFEFAPVDPQGKPLAFETWDPPGSSGSSCAGTARRGYLCHGPRGRNSSCMSRGSLVDSATSRP
jgi:hypothetical protein